MQDQVAALHMRVFVKVVNTLGVDERRGAFDTVDLIALLQKEFGEVGAILSSNSSNEGFLHADFAPRDEIVKIRREADLF
jgi:hypothetical protein